MASFAQVLASYRAARAVTAGNPSTVNGALAQLPVYAAPQPQPEPVAVTQPGPVADVKPTPAALTVYKVPDGLQVEPWAHQLRGYAACMQSLEQHHGTLLAAEMGVGKTLIATMLALGTGSTRTLVICPLRVLNAWRTQLPVYLAGEYVLTILDDKKSVAKRCQQLTQDIALAEARGWQHWVCVNYDAFWRDAIAEIILDHKWGAIIYDESHKLKSPSGKASMFAKRLRAKLVAQNYILATGTPMAHSPLDAYAQFRAAIPTLLGTSYVAFKNRYATWGGPNNRIRTGFQNLEELETRLAPVTWRATKEEVLPDLPEALPPIIYECELSSEAARVYREMERDLVTEIEGKLISAANVLTKILRLAQITGGAVRDDDSHYHQIDDSKRKLLQDVLEELGTQPVVIFCRFRSDIDAAHHACKLEGVEALELSGKHDQLQRWRDGEAQALIVQIQAGSVGIDLTRASTAIYYSLTTSLSDWDQSMARIHRPGQKNACSYLYLVARGTIDAKILAALQSRQAVIETIMDSIQAQGAK